MVIASPVLKAQTILFLESTIKFWICVMPVQVYALSAALLLYLSIVGIGLSAYICYIMIVPNLERYLFFIGCVQMSLPISFVIKKTWYFSRKLHIRTYVQYTGLVDFLGYFFEVGKKFA